MCVCPDRDQLCLICTLLQLLKSPSHRLQSMLQTVLTFSHVHLASKGRATCLEKEYLCNKLTELSKGQLPLASL